MSHVNSPMPHLEIIDSRAKKRSKDSSKKFEENDQQPSALRVISNI